MSYPDFLKSTGYKKAGGLCGFNCRHSFHPFDPAYDKPLYTDEQLSQLNNETIKLPNGKEVKVYQATQIQRAMERRLRKSKQGLEMAKVSGDTETQLKYKKEINDLDRQLKHFCKSTGLPRQLFRESVNGLKG